MAIAKIEPLQKFDLGKPMASWEERHEEGKKLRIKVPRESHGDWRPGESRRDPLKLLAASNKGRQEDLIP